MNNILQYRITYLKAVAKAWEDHEFKDQLLNSKNVLEFFESEENQALLNNYRNPWKNLTITVTHNDQVRWDPTLTAGWIGPDDSIELFLPEMPEKVEDRAQALMQYYHSFPDFLGPLKASENEAGGGFPSDMKGTPSMQLGIGDDEITDFGAFMLRIIALSWEDEQFLNELLEASEQDGTPVLSKYFGFNNTWNFNLRFRKAKEFKFDETSGRWTNIPANHINLWFPNAPDRNSLRPTALTLYNNNGPSYPFTCS